MSSTIGNVRLSNGETCFKQQLGLYNLPYGVFGTLSNIIQFYTFACLGFGRSPFRPSKQLKGTKSDLALSVAAYLTTTAAVAITLVNPDWMSVDSVCRMRKRYWWMYLLILAKFSLGLASGAWSWEMHGIARDKKLQGGANQNAVEERDENPQPNMHDGFDGEFAGGLERGRFTGGRTGWKLSGMFLVIEQIVGIAGLATHALGAPNDGCKHRLRLPGFVDYRMVDVSIQAGQEKGTYKGGVIFAQARLDYCHGHHLFVG